MVERDGCVLLSTNALNGPILALVGKEKYVFSNQNRMIQTKEKCPIQQESQYSEQLGNSRMRKLNKDSDLIAPIKRYTDIYVRGCAQTYGSIRTEVETAVSVNGIKKRVRAVGDRMIDVSHGQIQFGPPIKFDKMPLVWENAYGGRDWLAEEREGVFDEHLTGSAGDLIARNVGTIVYPRNPVGRGFVLNDNIESIKGIIAPNLEEPSDPVLSGRLLAKNIGDWSERPIAACYEAVDWCWFPRAAYSVWPEFEGSAEQLFEVEHGILCQSDLIDRNIENMVVPEILQSGCADFYRVKVCGNESISLWNIHPQKSLFEFHMNQLPIVDICPPNCRKYRATVSFSTLDMDAENECVFVTWCAQIPVGAVFYEDVLQEVQWDVKW